MADQTTHSAAGRGPGLRQFASFAGHAALEQLRRTGAKAFLRDLPSLVGMGLQAYRNPPAEVGESNAAAPVGAAAVPAPRNERPRAFDLQSLLRCPECGGRVDVSAGENRWKCASGAHIGQAFEGVPHFHRPGETPVLRMEEPCRTHPYGATALELLRGVGSGLALDFGSGSTPEDCLYPNVVYLDVQQFQYTDLSVTTERLPLADGLFDLVVSQAVFEHVEDPHGTARELFRVLKPGGTIYIDTAFMQPLHADPSHYFNMTVAGIRKVMAGFEEIKSGVAPYQNPSFGWQMQLDHVLPLMAEGFWKDQLTELRRLVTSRRREFDEALGERGREVLAAGYFYQGRKPG